MDRIERLRRANERDEAKARELARKRQLRGAKISQLSRADDTRRKVLAGSWALDEADKSEEFRERMMRLLDKVWLWRDDDRKLFGLPILSEEEKARREIAYGKAARRKAKEATDADAPASPSDSSADAPARTRHKETEAA